ncbi:MAG TPA: TIGR03067 domain-containing protein [Gemmataceae bacterium]|jgi:uncharacterized protein (TIGR03067 family)|nr:TIGR03067 domain-containing protein [Gemmataceae bacterium]
MSPTLLFAALALSTAAPKLKDPPRAESLIVGRWEVVKWTQSGSEMAFAENTVHDYTADGKRVIRRGDSAEDGERRFELVPKDGPLAVDLHRVLDGMSDHYRGIYKVEKDTMQLCIGRPGGDRPTAFESTADNGWILMTFKRAARKE